MDLHALLEFLKENGIVVNVLITKLASNFIVVLLSHTFTKIYDKKTFLPLSRFFMSVTISACVSTMLVENIPPFVNVWYVVSFVIGLMTETLPRKLIDFLNNPKTIDAMLLGSIEVLCEQIKFGSKILKNIGEKIKNRDESKGEDTTKNSNKKKENDEHEEVATSDEKQEEHGEIEQRIKREHRIKRH